MILDEEWIHFVVLKKKKNCRATGFSFLENSIMLFVKQAVPSVISNCLLN